MKDSVQVRIHGDLYDRVAALADLSGHMITGEVNDLLREALTARERAERIRNAKEVTK